MWEDNFDTDQLILTRTTATSLYLNRPSWNAALSSSYSTVANNDNLHQKALAFTNGLSFAYRFTSLLTLEPNVSFRQEWAPFTSLKTDTCSAGFGLTFTPSRDLQWIGRASYARDSSEDPLRAGSMINAATGLNWKLGKSFLGEQSVSMQLEYKNESRSRRRSTSRQISPERFSSRSWAFEFVLIEHSRSSQWPDDSSVFRYTDAGI